MKTDYECAEIIDESDEEYILLPKPESKTKTRKPKAIETPHCAIHCDFLLLTILFVNKEK